MNNRYVDFISDEHLTQCIANLHNSYLKAKSKVSKKNFYKNKVDTIKLTFDAKFNGIDEDELIQVEVLRQIDKSINNSIGIFHEQVLGGVEGFEIGKLSGFDIKAEDETLFAVFQFEELPFILCTQSSSKWLNMPIFIKTQRGISSISFLKKVIAKSGE